MNATQIMVAKLDALMAETKLQPTELNHPAIRKMVEQALLSEFEAAAVLAINLKVRLTEASHG